MKSRTINVKGAEVTIATRHGQDYICLTDMSNLTLKKIPKMVKDRCEWGHDDYSLNVANLPMAQKVAEGLPPQDNLFSGYAL